jgi:hypothetical protein
VIDVVVEGLSELALRYYFDATMIDKWLKHSVKVVLGFITYYLLPQNLEQEHKFVDAYHEVYRRHENSVEVNTAQQFRHLT